MLKTYDLFICHATEDKKFVRRLVASLRSYGVRVWLDESELKPGDSLHAAIERGITRSRYMLVVISRSSLRKAWVKRELRAGLSSELKRRDAFVIPALLDVGPKALPPMLSDKLAADFRTDWFCGVRGILRKLGISDRSARLNNPTHQQIQNTMSRLPRTHRKILLWQCWRRVSIHSSEGFRFTTEYLDLEERRTLRGLASRGLVRTKLVHTGLFCDQDEGLMNVKGWIFQGVFTRLGQRVAEILDQKDRRYLEESKQKQESANRKDPTINTG